jgi:type II secretory pathway pseudopilin PulG
MKINNKGQALVLILILAVVMVSVTTAAVAIVLTNSQLTSQTEIGSQALAAAESGAENALLLLLRDPYGYLGETIDFFDGSTALVSIPSGNYPKTMISTGKFGNFTRKVEIGLTYSNNELGISFWREIYQ